MKIALRAGLALALLLVAFAPFSEAEIQDYFTPLLVSPLIPATQAFLGTDGKMHVAYELVMTNANPTAATLQKVEVLDAADKSRVIATFEGQELLTDLRTVGNTAATETVIPFNQTRLLLLELSFDNQGAIPKQVLHRITLLGGGTPARTPGAATPLNYTVAPLSLGTKVPVISPPLAGEGWVAVNGCCGVRGVHRSTSMPVNGGIYFAQRFAIDWMKLGPNGRLLNGDPGDVHSYFDYGASVLAVADGTVVSTLNDLEDQVPGKLPDPKTMTLQNVDGNHVVLDLGNGVYAFYAHMQKGSVTVKSGDHVKRGQVLGKLGNTGNTSAPHLHFHLMDAASVLGSNGIPYVISSFEYVGQLSTSFYESDSITDKWDANRLAKPALRTNEFPMDLAIVDFGGK